MEFSNIFLNIKNFVSLENKIASQQNKMRKKTRKNKKININQTSFYFEDYIETNKKKNHTKK